MPRRKYAKGTKQNPIRIRTSRAEKKQYKRAARARRSYSKKKGMNAVTTFQKDVSTAYRYNRAPATLRKKWNRRRRTFTSNLLRMEGSRKFHYSGTMTWTTNPGGQNFFGWVNFGCNGTGGVDGTGDLQDVFLRMDRELRQSGTAAETVNQGAQSRRYYIDSSRCKIQMTNVGAFPVHWEVYECVARKDVSITEAATMRAYLNVIQQPFMQATLANSSGGGGLANSADFVSNTILPSTTSTGVTPFHYRHFCQAFKIMKVSKLQAAAGNSVSFDCGTTRNMSLAYDDIQPLLFKKYVTKMFLIRQVGAIETVTNTTPATSVSNVVVELEKSYNCKLIDTKLPQLNYQVYTNST